MALGWRRKGPGCQRRGPSPLQQAAAGPAHAALGGEGADGFGGHELGQLRRIGRVGGGERVFLESLKRNFRAVRHAKPPASRKDSSELYVVATGFRGREG